VIHGVGEPLVDARMRFSVAHEIAHCIVKRSGGSLPTTRSEYWKLEDLCNVFAADLLVPESAIAQVASSEPLELLRTTVRLSAAGRVSCAVAGRRISDSWTDSETPVSIAGLVGRFQRSSRSVQSLAKVEWSGAAKEHELGSGRFIGPRHRLFSVLEEAFDEDGMPSPRANEGYVRASGPFAVGVLTFTVSQVGVAVVGRTDR
jgi:hypothetical protein